MHRGSQRKAGRMEQRRIFGSREKAAINGTELEKNNDQVPSLPFLCVPLCFSVPLWFRSLIQLV